MLIFNNRIKKGENRGQKINERERQRAALTKKLVRSKRDAPAEPETLVVTKAPMTTPKISHEALIQESLETSMIVKDYIAGIFNDLGHLIIVLNGET